MRTSITVSSPNVMGRLRRALDPAEAIVVVIRLGVLALCLLLSLLSDTPVPSSAIVSLVVLAFAASVPLHRSRITALRPLLEALLAAAVIGAVDPIPAPLLPYLVVPPLAAGLISGALASSLASLASLVVLVAFASRDGMPLPRAEITLIAEWVGLGLATGLVGSWARSLVSRQQETTSTYVAAHRLLSRLRDVARTLPTGLDEVALAQQVLLGNRKERLFAPGGARGALGKGPVVGRVWAQGWVGLAARRVWRV